jgi:DNA processing protein
MSPGARLFVLLRARLAGSPAVLDLADAVALALATARSPATGARWLAEAGVALAVPTSAGGPSVPDWLARVPGLPSADAPLANLVDAANRLLERATRDQLTPLVLGDPRYPLPLTHIVDPPLVLWVRGNLAVLEQPTVAIVGARAASHAAVQLAFELAADLARHSVVIASGLARGVDSAAHRGALESGRTVAVLGSGVDVVYPPEHRALADAVLTQGALVSEFVPGTPPRSHHFPLRNRILSGLSLGVVVVEAAERSGSLITARLALEQGRDVMAVPGVVTGGRNHGAHALIRDGARLVECAADVIEELGLTETHTATRTETHTETRTTTNTETNAASVGEMTSAVLASLTPGEPRPLEDLVASTGRAAPALLGALLQLELSGDVARVEGGLFLRTRRRVVT